MVTMTTSNDATQQQTFPLGSDLTVATINVNGAHADQQDGSRIVPRVKVVLRHMKKLQVKVFAMQEPHLQMGSAQLEARSSSLTDLAKQHGYGCRAQLPPPPPHTRGGGGGTILAKRLDGGRIGLHLPTPAPNKLAEPRRPRVYGGLGPFQ